MKTDPKLKNIIWAVDPYTTDQATFGKIIQTMKSLGFDQPGYQVSPTYIYSPVEVLLRGTTGEYSEDALTSLTEKEFDSIAKEHKDFSLGELEILREKDPSITALCHGLLEHAKTTRAQMVVISTSAKKGLERFVLGSFAESFLHVAQIPALVINPNTQPRAYVKKILFPTDLSDPSFESWANLLPFAKGLGAEIVLYHKVFHPNEAFISGASMYIGGAPVSMEELNMKLAKEREEDAKKYLDLAKKQGVEVKLIVDPLSGSIKDSLKTLTQSESIDLIALTSKSGRIASTIIGSIARQIVREAEVPVWIQHPSS